MLQLVCFSFFLIMQASVSATRNNVCSSFHDYYSAENNPNCWYDFAVTDKAPSIITKSGYPYREYKVETEDDYILTVFRIPSENRNKGAVFLQHGIETTGKTFLSLGNDSLAFLFSDAGYDVWIGNYRGNEYSEGHKYLNVSMEKYWDYSIDDIALKDIPAMISLVKSNTPSKEKIVYVGHSLGTTLAMMYCSENQNHCKENIKHFFWLGPAYTLTHMKSPYKVLASFAGIIKDAVTFLNLIPEVSSCFKHEFRTLCLATPLTMQLCHSILNLFFGIPFEMRAQTVPVLLNQVPAGTSVKTLNFVKYTTDGEFKKYDYGPAKNLEVYGTTQAPVYDISTIDVNVSLFYSTSDWGTGVEDAEVLYKTLSKNVRYGNHKIDRPNFNHMDFLMGPSAKKLIYNEIIKVLNYLD